MFAVIDVETTGLRPGGSDRIVELAVVRLDRSCNILDEWTTLVHPEGPVQGSHVHGISNREVEDAPTFEEVTGDLCERLVDTTLVAHNARFDFAFVEAEFRRLGHEVSFEWLCTLRLAERLNFSPSRSLRSCCAKLGIAHEAGHAALVDAEATARLFAFLVAAAYERSVVLPLPPPLLRGALPAVAPSGRQLPRRRSPQDSTSSPLSRHVRNLPPAVVPVGADPAAVVAYTELLDRSLEDRRLDPDEALALCELAGAWGLTMDHLGEIHRSYIAALVGAAMADGVLSRGEHEDLRCFADVLGVPREAVLDDVAAALERLPQNEAERA